MIKNKRHPISDQTKAIWAMHNSGTSQKVIAAKFGVSGAVVSGAINRGRKSGHAKMKVKTVTTVYNKSTCMWGYIGQIRNQLSPDQAEWLFHSAEDCQYSSVAEYIAELVLDAFYEAKAKEANQ
jgi:DNA-binding transcriptional regulator LsrR (DeoR family)